MKYTVRIDIGQRDITAFEVHTDLQVSGSAACISKYCDVPNPVRLRSLRMEAICSTRKDHHETWDIMHFRG
jgi:hypothetical protein